MKLRFLGILFVAAILGGNLYAQGSRTRRKTHVIDRFNQLSPEKKRQVLKRLPPERKRLFEERLERYNRLAPEDRDRLREHYETFRRLPPEKQDEARRLFGRFQDLPAARRNPVRKELAKLRELPPEERQSRLDSEEFRDEYSAGERKLLKDLSEILSRQPGQAKPPAPQIR
ncbi:MAG: DUF3106 domain-containing protein [Bryobacteraceae bacterium]